MRWMSLYTSAVKEPNYVTLINLLGIHGIVSRNSNNFLFYKIIIALPQPWSKPEKLNQMKKGLYFFYL